MTHKVTQQYIDFFESHKADWVKNSTAKVLEEREKAIEIFKQNGFPTTKDERYKYTHLERVFDHQLDMSVAQKPIKLDVEKLFKCEVLKLDAHLALVAKGQMVSEAICDVEGLTICSFKEASEKYSKVFNRHYNTIAKNEEDGSVAINTALALDGVFIHIAPNKTIEKPIQVVNLQVDGSQNNAVQIRHLVVVEDNAEAKIIFCEDSLTCNQHLSSSVTETFVGKNARLEVDKIQNEHSEAQNIASNFVRQETQSVTNHTVISLLGGLIRNNLHIEMNGEHCEANAYGLGLIDQKLIFDNHTYIHHAYPNCVSNQLYKNILDDEAKGIFAGTVLVDKDAQKTNAFQSNNNVVLSRDAKMKTKPQLIIYADDVKCSHGATVGQLDENALFYMRARGIKETDAKKLLMYAFANDVIQKISVEALKENTEILVQRRLAGKLKLCRNCSSVVVKE